MHQKTILLLPTNVTKLLAPLAPFKYSGPSSMKTDAIADKYLEPERTAHSQYMALYPLLSCLHKLAHTSCMQIGNHQTTAKASLASSMNFSCSCNIAIASTLQKQLH
ncbi:hypothetical protein M758_4G226800 [Ceratodon purpureus]|nr:hypothetical protein M758_4G226800 [Ceratodon purpureus]